SVFNVLVTELAELELAPLEPVVEQHAAAARALADKLGKTVEVTADTSTLYARSELVDALGTALLHTLSNAVDHGIEAPDVRIAAGKPSCGTIGIVAKDEGDAIELLVVDDGRGIDVE